MLPGDSNHVEKRCNFDLDLCFNYYDEKDLKLKIMLFKIAINSTNYIISS